MATQDSTPEQAQPPARGVRILVSALVVVHLGGVFMGPFAMPPQTSELAATLAPVYRPYVDGLSLANGYRFFAPSQAPATWCATS